MEKQGNIGTQQSNWEGGTGSWKVTQQCEETDTFLGMLNN